MLHFYYNILSTFLTSVWSIIQDYAAAHDDFQLSLEMKKYQPIAMLYKGLTFYHRGMLKVSTLHKDINFEAGLSALKFW